MLSVNNGVQAADVGAGHNDTEVERIRASLERYAFGGGGDVAPDLVALRAISGEGLRQLRKERRAALLVDTARACSQAGNRDEALRRLLAAEDIAAPEVRCRPVAQAAIADLLHRSRGAPPLALARLAERAGVTP